MRRSVAFLAIVFLVGVSSCSAEDGDELGGTTTTRASGAVDAGSACRLLTGSEASRIPAAVEYFGLDGSIRYLASLAGPAIDGDVLVYVQPALAESLGEVADELRALDGVEVVGTRSQDEVYEDFVRLFDDQDVVTPGVLPPIVATRVADDSARAAVMEFRDHVKVYEVTDRGNLARTLKASLVLAAEQFESELDEIADLDLTELAHAASQMQRLAAEATDSELISSWAATADVFVSFMDRECDSIYQPTS